MVVPGYGASQGFMFVISDLLEDNQLYASVGSFQGRQLGSIVANVNAVPSIVNQSRRLNWGVGGTKPPGATSKATGWSPIRRPRPAGSV